MKSASLLPLLALLGAGAPLRAATDVSPTLPVIPERVFKISDFGAVPDDDGDDTAAFTKALAAVSAAGGGRLIVGPGLYHTGHLDLVSNLDFHLEKGARLLFTTDPEAYRIKDRKFKSLVVASGLEDLAITGEGTLDGQGQPWWIEERAFKATARARGDKNEEIGRPRLLTIEKSKRILVEGITLTNSPQFHFIPSRCEDITIRGVNVHSPADAPNTDGIDPAACQRVLISGCVIDTGDDNIAIKSGNPEFGPAADILIEHCTFREGHGMSIGSETNGGLHNLIVRNCTFEGTEAGIRMKSARGKGGLVEDLLYENLVMHDVGNAIEITSYYPNRTTPQPGDPGKAPATRDPATPAWRDIVIRNVRSTDGAKTAGRIIGLPEEPVTGVTLENVYLEAPVGLRVAQTRGIVTKNVEIKAAKGAPWMIESSAEKPRVQH